MRNNRSINAFFFLLFIAIISILPCYTSTVYPATAIVSVSVNSDGSVVPTVEGIFETCGSNNSGSVSLYRDSSFLCQGTGNGGASCSITLDRWYQHGTHVYTGNAYDCTGHDQDIYPLTLDNTPELTITSPADNDIVFGPIDISGIAVFKPTLQSIKGIVTVHMFRPNGALVPNVLRKQCSTEVCPFSYQEMYGSLLNLNPGSPYRLQFIAGGGGAEVVKEVIFSREETANNDNHTTVPGTDICPAPNSGICNPSGNRSVNVINGRVITRETDFSMLGIMPVNFTRYYNSKTAQTTLGGGYGRSGRHIFDTIAINLSSKRYKVANPDGSIVYYYDANGDNVYEPDIPVGETSTLIKNPDSTLKRTFKDGTSEEFNTAGYLSAFVDRNGNRITLTRDGSNKLTKITDPGGREITLTYNTSQIISKITLPDGKEINYTYYYNMLYKTTYPDGKYKIYEFSNYNLTGIKNEKGNYIEKYTYDAQGRAITASADGTNEKLTFNYVSDTETTVTDTLGRVTTYTIDKSGGEIQGLSSSGPGCGCGAGGVSFTYDNKLNITSTTDANGTVTTFTYDSKNNMLTKTEAYGTPVQRTSTYSYEPTFGQITSVTDPMGNTTDFNYDDYGNLISITDPNEATTTFTHNAQGLITQITDAQSNPTNFTYDQYGNISTMTDALSNTTTLTYNIMGNLLSVIDANNNQTTYTYDQRWRPTQVRDSLNHLTTYTYDPAGNLTAVTDAKNQTTQFLYDNINRLIRETNALGNQRNYTYNTVSNLISKTDANNNITNYIYDDYNRLITIDYPGDSDVTFTYDLAKNLTGATNQNISYTFAYDALNRKTSVTDSLNRTISYTYDADSNRLTMTDPAGIIQYAYNPLNLVTTISNSIGQVTYSYDNLGRRTSLSLPNQISTTYTYDSLSRLLSIINGSISTNTYAYDNVGNRTSMTEQSGTHNYAYDVIYRLIQATHPAPPTEQFTYDQVGNRLTDNLGNSYFYNNANRLLNYNGVTFTYDANGNVTSRVDSCSTTIYTWDSENRLTGISGFKPDCSTLAASYQYDSFGRRIEKNINETITRYLYDKEDIIAEYDGNNQLIAHYIHGPGIDEPIAMVRNSQSYFYHFDGLGSVTGITDSNGSVVQRYGYESFGNIVSMLDPNFIQPYTYTGREYDPETGSYYYRARYYDSRIGRFISEDPIGLAGDINKYVYVQNNPVNWIDPLGLAPHDAFIAQLAKMANKSLRKTIKSLMKQIEKHEKAVADECQKQAKQHHEHELRVFKEQLKLAEQEVAKRGLVGAGFAESISEDEAEKRTGSWFDWIDPFLFPGTAY